MWVVVAGALVGGQEALADTPTDETIKAASSFEAGQKLIAASQIDLACDSFQASLETDPALGTRLNLADCRERQGRLVDAYKLFAAAAEEAAGTKKPGRLKFARERMAALVPKLVQLELVVASPDLDGLVIKVDGVELRREGWTIGSWFEPSTIVVDASAPGHVPFHKEVAGTAGARVAIQIPVLEQVPEVPQATLPIPVTPVTPVTPPPPRPRALTPVIVGSAGSALAIAGLALSLHARARYHEELGAQLPDLNARLDGPQREADAATVMGIAGTVTIGAAVVLYLRDRRDRLMVAPIASARVRASRYFDRCNVRSIRSRVAWSVVGKHSALTLLAAMSTIGCRQLYGLNDVPVDAAGVDADLRYSGVDALRPDAWSCFGSLATACFDPTAVPESLALSGTLDTGNDVRCVVVPQAQGPALCVIVGGTIAVSGTTNVRGARALVLIATTTLSIDASLDGSSHRGGDAGPAAASCASSVGGGGTPTTGGGGGGGGSFGGAGGVGGMGYRADPAVRPERRQRSRVCRADAPEEREAPLRDLRPVEELAAGLCT